MVAKIIHIKIHSVPIITVSVIIVIVISVIVISVITAMKTMITGTVAEMTEYPMLNKWVERNQKVL